ncbi:MAG: hypothetical protein HOP00_12790, partial [Nitrospira sp.]|nr:hypothetical protein [Nitrospira sp.]
MIFPCPVYSHLVMLATPPPITVARNTILIFMEAEPFAQSLKKAFEASGYQSTVVTTESAAYAAARTSVPSLIIVDRQQR